MEQSSTPKRVHKFSSRFSPDKKVIASQYITELICERKAIIDNKGDLPNQFWKITKWEKFYKSQIPAAVKLLKKYRVDAILSALRDKRTKGTYSLRSPFFDRIVREYEKKKPAEVKALDPIERVYECKGQFIKKKSNLEELD